MKMCQRCGKMIPGAWDVTEVVLCRECSEWLSSPSEIKGVIFDSRQDRYTGFDPPIWTPMEISFTLEQSLTEEQIDALFPLDQLGDDPRWVEAIQRMKETNRRAMEDERQKNCDQ